MTPEKIALVQDSFAKVAPIAPQAGAAFYDRLFEIAPEVRPMFKDDLTDQAAKLMTTLGVVVKGLTDLPKIIPVAEQLARRHVSYGVTEDQYGPVGAALIDTLSAGLGDDFTPEVKAAWEDAYATLSGVMIAAAYHEETVA
ncbi:hemin receptor [Aliishimia ponticola]|uniref:Hemin receptor n=1 Tax=Aliishimia ponticola TaxID=2499833 RepID=A0A4S4NHG7_9RHOB|nr:globin family protein [Aliishimia ponticola]THH39136.1 hemin receptor [Aliishimia ponticola]